MVRRLLAIVAVLLVAAACTDSSEDAGGDAAEEPSEQADLVLTADGATVRATVDDRFQSYDVEMVEVTGGNFWAPYDAADPRAPRPPIDLSSERLRNLAAELGPALVRVSGTWANSTWFDAAGSTGGTPPEGFQGVLTTEQWDGVGDFATAVDAEIVTSFASNEGVRDDSGVWQPDQARALLEYSRDNDVPLVAAEFYNEPSLNIGVIPDYDAAAFGRDFETFRSLVEDTLPEMQIAGPGAVDDVTPLLGQDPPLAAEDMLREVSPAFDAFSYHFYPKVSERCASEEGPEIALTEEYLSRIETDRDFYEDLRDTHEPDAPMWITETAQAACGGDRWAATYLDVFRYLDTLGRLASGDGDIVFHNTLSASDYGLIDEDGFEPRPNYWAAVLWQRLMGPGALELDLGGQPEDLLVHAHCTAGSEEPEVTYLVINLSEEEAREVSVQGAADLYLLTGDDLMSPDVQLNGEALEAAADGTLPALAPEATGGTITVPPTSVAFVVAQDRAAACGAG